MQTFLSNSELTKRCLSSYGGHGWHRGLCTNTICIAISGDHVDPAAYTLKSHQGETLLDRKLLGMVEDISECKASNMAGWRHLGSDAISASADHFHILSRYRDKTYLELFLDLPMAGFERE
jgi:hypothetical protein